MNLLADFPLITAASVDMRLLPHRAVFLPGADALLIADLHLGKAERFLRAGIPIPPATESADLLRLSRALEVTGASHLIILGDLLHAPVRPGGYTAALLSRWRADHAALQVTLIRGNHDQPQDALLYALGLGCVDEPLEVGGLSLCHMPERCRFPYGIAGHLHPLAQLAGAGNALRLPCFWFGPRAVVLPAFSTFVDGRVIRPALGDRVFVVADDQVLPVG